MVDITIDGKKLEVPAGITVIEAARQAGIEIPTLCDHPKLTPYGGCRLCLVEVEGARTLQTSCTLPVNNNMVVHTDTEKVREARKFVLTMLFSERNHFCPYCVVNDGDCELQESAYGQGMTHWPIQPNWQPFKVDASHPYFILDHNRCILCRRCVRACGELVGNYTLGVEERGAKSIIVADLGTPLGESTCISCGVCVQICPTGALIDRWSAFRGQQKDLDEQSSICTACSIGCGINVISRDNNLVRIEGNWDAPVNDGVLCKLGRFIPMDEQRERLLTPLARVDGKLKATTWEKAIDTVASQIKPLVGKKSDGIAAIASSSLSVESLDLFKEIFADQFNSDVVTTFEEGLSTSAAAALAEELGGPFEAKLDVIEKADCIIVASENLVNNHEVIGFMVKRHAAQGCKLIVIDSEENDLAKIANASLKPAKGSETETFKLIADAIAKKKDLQVGKTGLKAEKVQEIAAYINKAKTPVFIYGKGILTAGAIKALYEVSKTANASLIGVKGKANSFAASQLRLDKPFQVEKQHAAFVLLGDDEPSQKVLQSLAKIPFLVVAASYASQLTAMAHVVLPIEPWFEQEGHFVSMDGQLQKQTKALKTIEEIHSSEIVLKDIASALGLKIKEDAWKEHLFQRTPTIAIVE